MTAAFPRRYWIVAAYAVLVCGLYAMAEVTCLGAHDQFLCGYNYSLAAFVLLAPSSYAAISLPPNIAYGLPDEIIFGGTLLVNCVLLAGILHALRKR